MYTKNFLYDIDKKYCILKQLYMVPETIIKYVIISI